MLPSRPPAPPECFGHSSVQSISDLSLFQLLRVGRLKGRRTATEFVDLRSAAKTKEGESEMRAKRVTGDAVIL